MRCPDTVPATVQMPKVAKMQPVNFPTTFNLPQVGVFFYIIIIFRDLRQTVFTLTVETAAITLT